MSVRRTYWFYRLLSVVYGKHVNPLFWTERMRDPSLTLEQMRTDSSSRAHDLL